MSRPSTAQGQLGTLRSGLAVPARDVQAVSGPVACPEQVAPMADEASGLRRYPADIDAGAHSEHPGGPGRRHAWLLGNEPCPT